MIYGDDDEDSTGLTDSAFNIRPESDDEAPVKIGKLKSSLDSNTTKPNEVISSMGLTLKIEKVKLQEVRTGLLTNHAEFNSSVFSKIPKLQDDLGMERKIMDAHSLKIEKVKVLTVKLENT
ncbi:unnamed protein product [Lactuca saligna]|uniref:Uncharacterized protein n=1 Tax=Lactuca saligna TaxID=75948 RepID=A0AA36EFC5_LACSI|nr:unnamed protein product [Lactuca saligna]